MKGLGTLINVGTVLAGGILGLLFGKKIKDRMKETVTCVVGVAVMMMATGGVIEKMMTVNGNAITSSGTLMMICSLAIGTFIGEIVNIDRWIGIFGEWLKKKSKSQGDSQFVESFVMASCTFCIGAMTIVGAIEDGISGNYSILLAKSVLDGIMCCIMASTTGKGCVFSIIPIALIQGGITVIAMFAGSFMSEAALYNLSYVGNVLIFCVGLNLTFDKKIRVANMLPAIIAAAIWGAVAK